ncbi:MAG: LPS export ABC transporter permease LptG [Gammaproteobacteria bacterium]
MSILDRYLGLAVLGGTLIALLVLMALASFFAFVGEIGDIGKGTYGLQDALLYTLYTLPRRAYEMFPMAALLGSLLGLGSLASNSELVVIRAIGFSVGRIVRSAALAGLVIMVVAATVGEWVAPPGEQAAENIRNEALSDTISFRGRLGYWVRDGRDFINIREIAGRREIRGVTIYRFGDGHRLDTLVEAERGVHDPDLGWTLYGATEHLISEEGVLSRSRESVKWSSHLMPEMINVAVIKPETLAAWDLLVFVRYMEENGLDGSRYELAYWKKLVSPLVTVVMVLLSIPFVFGSLRDSGTGQRVLVGILVGIGFHVVNLTLSHLGLLYGVPPLLSAITPPLMFFGLALWAIGRVR